MPPRAAVLLLLLLPACAASVAPVPRLEPPRPAGRTAPLAVLPLDVRLPADAVVGSHHRGLLRVAKQEHRWPERFAGHAGWTGAVTQRLLELGHPVFEQADLRLQGTLLALTFHTYSALAGDRAEALVEVRWQFQDAADAPVAEATVTQGSATAGIDDDGCVPMALVAALDNLLAQPAVVALLQRQGERLEPLPFAPAGPAALALPADAAQLRSFLLRVGDGRGVLIGTDGTALAPASAASGRTTVPVTLASGLELDAEVVRLDRGLGVALLRLPGKGHPAAALGGTPAVGSAVFVPADSGVVEARVVAGPAGALACAEAPAGPAFAADGGLVGLLSTAPAGTAAVMVPLPAALAALGLQPAAR